MYLYQNVQTYPRRENYSRQESILNTIIAAFFNHTYNIVYKRINSRPGVKFFKLKLPYISVNLFNPVILFLKSILTSPINIIFSCECVCLSVCVCLCVCMCVCVCVCVCVSLRPSTVKASSVWNSWDCQGADQPCCVEDVGFLYQFHSSLLWNAKLNLSASRLIMFVD